MTQTQQPADLDEIQFVLDSYDAANDDDELDGLANEFVLHGHALVAEVKRLRSALEQAIDFATLHGLDRPGDEIAQEVFANLHSALGR